MASTLVKSASAPATSSRWGVSAGSAATPQQASSMWTSTHQAVGTGRSRPTALCAFHAAAEQMASPSIVEAP
jgi:hypothetical protein